MSEIRRRVKLEIHIGADDHKGVEHVLMEISRWWDEKTRNGAIAFNSVTGGPDSGWRVNGDVDESWTHDRYFEEIEKMKAAEKAAAQEGAVSADKEESRLCDGQDCGKPAAYYIYPEGPVSFEDFFHVCPDHLGDFMGWTTVNDQRVDRYVILRPCPTTQEVMG